MRALSLTITAHVGRNLVQFVRPHLIRAHQLLKPALRELSIAIVNDQTMSELHGRYMGDKSPTDVLTFPLDLDSRMRPISGEVVICLPEARRRAKEVGTDLKSEVLLYALHGMLHLCGFDDRTSRDHRTMHAMEDKILTQLGVGPVFAPRQPVKRQKGLL